MTKRLWDKGEALNEAVHGFTVGDDPIIDQELVRHDVIGSAAHVRMLQAVNLISRDECSQILASLRRILALSDQNDFEIPRSLEDCHTAIEAFITNDLGDAGRKVHTGRSRNDQVMLAVRLYLRSRVIGVLEELSNFAAVLSSRFDQDGSIVMPGYTHMQAAMPSSVGMWLHGFYEGLLDLLREGLALLESADSNPLGTGAGFGVSLPLDRKLTAELLGFSRVQRSPIDVQNSRGRYELRTLRWACDISGLVEKFAWDLLLYSTKEFGFFALPNELTTGSSIMPQKHNPDVLELLRGRAAKVRGATTELEWVIGKLPSSYHRDFQLTKAPLVNALNSLGEVLDVVKYVAGSFAIDEKKIETAMSPELYATYDAYRAVKAGVPFRDAYKATAEKVRAGALDVPALAQDFVMIADGVRAGMTEARRDFEELGKKIDHWRALVHQVEERLLG